MYQHCSLSLYTVICPNKDLENIIHNGIEQLQLRHKNMRQNTSVLQKSIVLRSNGMEVSV